MAAFSIAINNSMTRDGATRLSFVVVGKITHNLSNRGQEKVIVIG
jgi:hypothetical protein